MNLTVDGEKLTYGLEEGLVQARVYMDFAKIPRENRLRYGHCGLVSAAIAAYAQREGIDARLLISRPQVDTQYTLEHVVALLETDQQNPLVVDASPSGLLGHIIPQKYPEEAVFPSEKILHFNLQDTQRVVAWFAKAVRDVGEVRSLDKVAPFCEAVYSPSSFRTWMPPGRVLEQGEIVGAAIPEGTITIQ